MSVRDDLIKEIEESGNPFMITFKEGLEFKLEGFDLAVKEIRDYLITNQILDISEELMFDDEFGGKE